MGHSGAASHSSELKRSCEECSSSKVKCSQDRPICKRCRKHRIECNYTPPKRTGRPRKIPKDGSGSQARTIRPLASAPPDNIGSVSVALVGDHPSSGTMVEQDMVAAQHQAANPANDLFGLGCAELDSTGTSDIMALHGPGYELLDHEWLGHTQTADMVWGAALIGQSCGQGVVDDGHAQFRNNSLAAEQYGNVQEIWRQQLSRSRSISWDDQTMYSDPQLFLGENTQLVTYDQDMFVESW
ncbi:hypothetical protein NQ176_g9679 [Zarea fungicola]|uniref:Uncharacterized protein n=1 Tax=Zarea fungicola TaxID=93591 RepID=A0ACC1MM40_9HYPO|nr:hypothetical protein NQ176_g9679 [Lecanicillium fungicola]